MMDANILFRLFVLIFVGIQVILTNGQIQDELPAEITECLQLLSQQGNSSDLNYGKSAESIQTYCLQQFMWKLDGVQWSDFNITEDDVAYLNSLMGSLMHQSRQKRQTGPTTPQTGFRIRQEYRRLTDGERSLFHNTLQRLKRTGRYDIFANYHTGVAISSAHEGPNFPSWHRVYLSLFEEAMREINPGSSIALPYWDSTFDFDMPNPVNSIIWSEPFLGNGNGLVTTGPFANWMTNALELRRNIGGGSTLFTKPVVSRILTRCRNSEILPPTATRDYNFDFYHGGPHVWVGGQLAFLNSAAHDPVFFLHHAFVDYIWEQFRTRQVSVCRVNPESDYPASTGLHAPERRMDFFSQYRNIDGYQNYWTQNWYRYESSPTCTRRRPSCGTPYLRCDTRRQICVSVERPVLRLPSAGTGIAAFDIIDAGTPASDQQARVLETAIDAGPRFMAPPAEPRTQEARAAVVV